VRQTLAPVRRRQEGSDETFEVLATCVVSDHHDGQGGLAVLLGSASWRSALDGPSGDKIWRLCQSLIPPKSVK
jgi:hypothetical protein